MRDQPDAVTIVTTITDALTMYSLLRAVVVVIGIVILEVVIILTFGIRDRNHIELLIVLFKLVYEMYKDTPSAVN